MVHPRLSRPLALGIALALLLPVALFGGIAPVRAAPPTITTSAGPSNLVPFLTTAATITWDTGDGTPGTVCFYVSGPLPPLLFAQGASRSQVAPFIGQSGFYTFALFRGTISNCPLDPFTAAARVTLTKENPLPAIDRPEIGAALALIAPTQPVTGVAPCPAPQPASGGGAFLGTFGAGSAATGQYVPYATGVPPFAYPPGDAKDFLVTASMSLPRTLCVAFDAGFYPDGRGSRPAINVGVSVNSAPPVLLAQGPYGYVRLDAVVSGSYRFSLYEPPPFTGLGIAIPFADCTGNDASLGLNGSVCDEGVTTTTNIKTTASSYSGGTSAVVPFAFDLGAFTDFGTAPPANRAGGNPALVCLAGPSFPVGGTVAALNNGGAGVGTVTNLPAVGGAATVYGLQMYEVTFPSGPQQIATATGGCFSGPNNFIVNATGAHATLSVPPVLADPPGPNGFTLFAIAP